MHGFIIVNKKVAQRLSGQRVTVDVLLVTY